jgi:hypothetical protein
MRLFYVPSQGSICVLDKTQNMTTRQEIKGKFKDQHFSQDVTGYGDVKMSWINRDVLGGNKETYGKSCVLEITNFKESKIIENKSNEIRAWFCRGAFKNKSGKNKNYDPNNPIVVTNGLCENKKQVNHIEFKNVAFSLKVGNFQKYEKRSGATTILRVFKN